MREPYFRPDQAVPQTEDNPTGSPYKIKMRNPIVAGAVAAVGRVAGAVGGAVFRGAVATAGRSSTVGRFLRRGAIGATRFKRRALNYLGGQSAFDPLQSRAQVLAGTFQQLERTSIGLNQNFAATSQRLANFSPEIAMQRAMNRVNQIGLNFDQARRLGKPLAEFERNRGRIEIAQQRIQSDVQELLLPFQNAISEKIADLTEVAAGLSRVVTDKLTAIAKYLSSLVTAAIDNFPFLRDILTKINGWYTLPL